MLTLAVTDLDSAKALVAHIGELAAQRGIRLRPAPIKPDYCCGRDCAGCVWAGYFSAVEHWRREALEQLSLQGGDPESASR